MAHTLTHVYVYFVFVVLSMLSKIAILQKENSSLWHFFSFSIFFSLALLLTVMVLVRLSTYHVHMRPLINFRTANRSTRAVSLRSERSLSRGFPSLDLDTVMEERSDQEQTQVTFLYQ